MIMLKKEKYPKEGRKMRMNCKFCKGTGYAIDMSCPKCKGLGEI